MGILLRTLPELSFGHALGKGDKNWISECLSKRFCFGFTPIHSLSAEIQPFYVRRRFATSAAQMPLYEKSSWKIEQILCVQWSETKWQIGGGPMFFGYCAPNWLSSQLGNLTTQRRILLEPDRRIWQNIFSINPWESDTLLSFLMVHCSFSHSSILFADVMPNKHYYYCILLLSWIQTRPNPVSQQQQRKFTSMKPTTNNSSSACKSNCKWA